MEREEKHLKQEYGYGCGLYAIANIFQDKNFITIDRLEESKKGNHTGQLNKWLLEYGQDLYLEPLYFNSMGKKLPKWICEIRPSGDNVVSIPILIDTQSSISSKTHFVAAEIMTNGVLLVIDSLTDRPYISSLTEFNKLNHRVFGVWYLRSYSEEGYFMRFK